MRVTGGIYSGRKIICPKGVIRPAMDRMRESLFSILGDISGTAFLDLFSGSGIVGIEAASRGAEPVILIEKDRLKKQTLLNNISFVKSNIKMHLMPVEVFLKTCKDKFNIVFIDPPFIFKNKTSVILQISTRDILLPGARIIIHHSTEEYLPETVGALTLYDRRKYGQSILDFFKNSI